MLLRNIAEAYVPVMIKVHEDAPRVIEQGTCGATHSSAQHAHSVRYVGACLRGAVEQGAHQGHILAVDVRVDAPLAFCEERGLDMLGQVLGGRRM
eukprot:1729981-Pleurochrysis_carterae.AAC.2